MLQSRVRGGARILQTTGERGGFKFWVISFCFLFTVLLPIYSLCAGSDCDSCSLFLTHTFKYWVKWWRADGSQTQENAMYDEQWIEHTHRLIVHQSVFRGHPLHDILLIPCVIAWCDSTPPIIRTCWSFDAVIGGAGSSFLTWNSVWAVSVIQWRCERVDWNAVCYLPSVFGSSHIAPRPALDVQKHWIQIHDSELFPHKHTPVF